MAEVLVTDFLFVDQPILIGRSNSETGERVPGTGKTRNSRNGFRRGNCTRTPAIIDPFVRGNVCIRFDVSFRTNKPTAFP